VVDPASQAAIADNPTTRPCAAGAGAGAIAGAVVVGEPAGAAVVGDPAGAGLAAGACVGCGAAALRSQARVSVSARMVVRRMGMGGAGPRL